MFDWLTAPRQNADALQAQAAELARQQAELVRRQAEMAEQQKAFDAQTEMLRVAQDHCYRYQRAVTHLESAWGKVERAEKSLAEATKRLAEVREQIKTAEAERDQVVAQVAAYAELVRSAAVIAAAQARPASNQAPATQPIISINSEGSP